MIKVTLLVKEGPQAEDRIIRKLNEWYVEPSLSPPYRPGTLLAYTIHPQPITVDERLPEPREELL